MKFNEEEMLQFAQKLGRKLEPQDVIVLTGELGAGKTTFTKGLALGLEIHQMVKKSNLYNCQKPGRTFATPSYGCLSHW